MFHRIQYLNSTEGGSLPSDFLRFKYHADKAVQAISIKFNTALGQNYCPALGVLDNEHKGSITRESTDPGTRKDERGKYIRKLKKWVKEVENVMKHPSKLRPANTGTDLEMGLLAEQDATFSEQDKQALQQSIDTIKMLLPQLEEAHEIERYIKVYEVRVTDRKEILVDKLEYNPNLGQFELKDAKDLPPPLFKIINGRRYVDKEEFGISADEKTYAKLQRLGATLNYKVARRHRDEALTAQLINEYGVYRRKVMYALIRREERTDTFNIKEKLCQHLFNRFTALQKVESAYGGSINELQAALNKFNAEIERLDAEATDEIAKYKRDEACTTEERAWYDDIFATYKEGLAEDKKFAAKLQQKIDNLNPHVDRTVELYKPGNDRYDTRLTLDELANEITQQANAIIGSGILASKLVDVSGKLAISSGQFAEATANAIHRCNNFTFPISVRMDPEYQGKFKGVRQISASELASGERDTRDILFALICAKVGDITNPDQLRLLLEEIQPAIVSSRGWRRLLCCARFSQRQKMEERMDDSLQHTDAQVAFKLYPKLRSRIQATDESFFQGAASVFKMMGGAMQRAARDSWHGFWEITGVFATNLKGDFTYVATGPASSPNVYTMKSTSAASTMDDHKAHADVQEHKEQLVSGARQSDHKRQVEYTDGIEQVHIKYKDLPAFKPQIEPDLLSVFQKLFSDIGGYYIKRYRAKPLIWFGSTIIGVAGGATAYIPEEVTLALEKMGLGKKWAEGFVAMSIAISEATTKSASFQLIGTATTIQQVLAMFLETLSDGADSMAIQGLAEIKRNLPIAAIGIGGSIGFGKLLSELFEVFKDDLGKQEVIAEFFSGLKVALLAYESFVAEAGERSPFANTAAGTLNLALNMVRGAISLIQIPVILGSAATGNPGIAASAWENIGRPWSDIGNTLANTMVSALDTTLKIGTTGAQGTAALISAGKEFICYPLAKMMPHRLSTGFVKVTQSAEQAVSRGLITLHNETTRRFARYRERQAATCSQGIFRHHAQLKVIDTEQENAVDETRERKLH